MTPLQKQYLSIKSKYPDAVLLFRVGDFYEAFGNDAKIIASTLGLPLTVRDKADPYGMNELAGFAHRDLESYLPKLINAGYRVAICDQLEDPNQEKAVRRAVTMTYKPDSSVMKKAAKRPATLTSNSRQADLFNDTFITDMLATLGGLRLLLLNSFSRMRGIDMSTVKKAQKAAELIYFTEADIQLVQERLPALSLPYPTSVTATGGVLIDTPNQGRVVIKLEDVFVKIAEYEQLAKGRTDRFIPPGGSKSTAGIESLDSQTSKSIMRNVYRDALRKRDDKTRKALEAKYGFTPFMDDKTKRVADAMGLKAQRTDLSGLRKLKRQRSSRSTLATAFTGNQPAKSVAGTPKYKLGDYVSPSNDSLSRLGISSRDALPFGRISAVILRDNGRYQYQVQSADNAARLEVGKTPYPNDQEWQWEVALAKSTKAAYERQYRLYADTYQEWANDKSLAINSTQSSMTTAEKEAFKKRMAKGKAKAAASAKKAAPKKSTKAAAARPRKTATVRAKATGLKARKAARTKTATQKAGVARSTVRVKKATGANFIRQVDKLAKQIHEKSATGRTVQVPVYSISRSTAKKRAFKALSAAGKSTNVTNIRLKVK